MTARWLTLALAITAGATIVAAAGETFSPEGLELEVTLTKKGPLQPGEPIDVIVSLANRSKTATHRVVRSGDGSAEDWREPHVFWTATYVGADGVERAVDRVPRDGRCGNFADAWWRDATSLAPGATIKLDWFERPEQTFDLQQDGKVRLVAHYAWGGGSRTTTTISPDRPPDDLGGMKGIAPYELTSKSTEFEIRRQLDIVARVKSALHVGKTSRLSEIVDLQVINRSELAVQVDVEQWHVSIRTEPVNENWQDFKWIEPDRRRARGVSLELAPGASTPAFGSGPLANGRDIEMHPAGAQKRRIAFVLTHRGSGPRIRSNWIDLRVEE